MTKTSNANAMPSSGSQRAAQQATQQATAGVTSSTGSGTPPKSSHDASSATLVASRDVKSFELHAPMIDVRGWNVVGPTGSTIGTVDRIMLDATDQTPRYLAVTPSNRQGRLLLPIGLGSLDKTRKQVVISQIKPEMLNALPLLTSDVVTREFERSVVRAIGGTASADPARSTFYGDPMFDASRLFGGSTAASSVGSTS